MGNICVRFPLDCQSDLAWSNNGSSRQKVGGPFFSGVQRVGLTRQIGQFQPLQAYPALLGKVRGVKIPTSRRTHSRSRQKHHYRLPAHGRDCIKQEIVRQYLCRGWVDTAISVHPQYTLYAYKRELPLLTQTQYNSTIRRDDRINQGHSYICQSGNERYQLNER